MRDDSNLIQKYSNPRQGRLRLVARPSRKASVKKTYSPLARKLNDDPLTLRPSETAAWLFPALEQEMAEADRSREFELT
jgi:hypothetical protein